MYLILDFIFAVTSVKIGSMAVVWVCYSVKVIKWMTITVQSVCLTLK